MITNLIFVWPILPFLQTSNICLPYVSFIKKFLIELFSGKDSLTSGYRDVSTY